MSTKLPKPGQVYRYKKLLYWAQGGVICIEDTRDGEFKTESRVEFAARVITIRTVLAADRYKYADERNEDFNFVINGAAAVKEARKQGDPFDPKVLESVLKHRRRSFIFTGDGSTASVSYGGVLGVEDGEGTRQFSYDKGRSVVLHTVSQDEAPAQKALLPPIPTKPD